MFRHLMIIAAAVAAAGPAAGSIPPPTPSGICDPPRAVPVPARPYQVTPDTEVLLDGRRVDYRAVPPGARIAYLEVTPDGEVLTAHFLSPPGPPARGRRR